MADSKSPTGSLGKSRIAKEDLHDTEDRVRDASGALDKEAAQRSSFGRAAVRQQAAADQEKAERSLDEAARAQTLSQEEASRSVFGRAAQRQQAEADQQKLEAAAQESSPAVAPAPAPAVEAAPAPAPEPRTYTVVPGESLGRIAERMYGDWSQWKRIFEANRDKISNPDLIYPGQTFVIPD